MAKEPYDPTNVLLDNGSLAQCATSADGLCCYTKEYADLACKRKFGQQYGFSNVTSEVATPSDDPTRPKLPQCVRGQPYVCRANVTEMCKRGYNKDGPYGTDLRDPNPPWFVTQIWNNTPQFWSGSDSYCRKYGPNGIRAFGDQNYPIDGRCVRAEWKKASLYPDEGKSEYAIRYNLGFAVNGRHTRPSGTMIPSTPSEPLEKCCNPNEVKDMDQVCDPQTCFGKKACDQSQYAQQFCSDKDNVANDPACIDSCLRLNNVGSSSWCNAPIKNYCQGKNLESEACRTYCTAANLDKNPDLAAFCDNQYVNYCQRTDNEVDIKRQKQLCGCINSPFPLASCVDAACSNQISVMTSNLRKVFRDNLCPNICTQNIVIDGKAVVDIDRVKWQQYCPGVPVPGDGDNPYTPPDVIQKEKESKLMLQVGVPIIFVLLILALVFLFV